MEVDRWLSAGPRGRRLCWSLLRERLVGPAWQRVWRDPAPPRGELVAELAAALESADLATLLGEHSGRGFMFALDEAVNSAMYWQPPDPVDQVLADPEFVALLEPFARAVATASPDWWSEPVDLATIHAVEYGEPFPTPAPELTGAADRLAAWRTAVTEEEQRFKEYTSDVSGSWWSTPAHRHLPSTTRALPEIGALALALTEDRFGWTSARCHPVAPRRAVRVWEIDSAEDWTVLVDRYPLRVSDSRRYVWEQTTSERGAWLIPSFPDLSADYDGVHLSTRGYLESAGRALRIDEVWATVLAGWAPDETYWLTDCLAPTGEPRWWATVEQGGPLDWTPADDPA
jgi:hypothetical protein